MYAILFNSWAYFWHLNFFYRKIIATRTPQYEVLYLLFKRTLPNLLLFPIISKWQSYTKYIILCKILLSCVYCCPNFYSTKTSFYFCSIIWVIQFYWYISSGPRHLKLLYRYDYVKLSALMMSHFPVPDRGTGARDRRALQQLALNVHVKHSDLTWCHNPIWCAMSSFKTVLQ